MRRWRSSSALLRYLRRAELALDDLREAPAGEVLDGRLDPELAGVAASELGR